MKKLIIRAALLISPLLAVPGVQAAYNPAIVAADARWVLHADFDALRNSALGKELVSAIEAAQRQATGGMIGIDIPKLITMVGSVTAYGTNLSPDPNKIDGTLIAQGTPNLRKIAESLLLQGTIAEPNVFVEVKDLPFPAYAVSDPNAKNGEKTQVVIAFPPEPILLVSKSKTQLVKARDVFRGTAPSLAKAPSTALSKPSVQADGAYIYSATMVPTEPFFPENAPQARILQLTKSASVAFGERAGNVFTHAELLASSDHNAEKLLKILQGMTAMLGLAETNDKQLGEFLRSVEVTRNDMTVTLDLAYSSARLAQMIQTLRTESEAKPVRRQPTITSGRTLAEWGGGTEDAASPSAGNEATARTVENVKLVNGAMITVGRALNGAPHSTQFTSLEITPAEGGGAPMTFRPEFMRNVRNTMWQIPFPGADGVYNIRVALTPDAEGKAKFALSVSDPKRPGESKAKSK